MAMWGTGSHACPVLAAKREGVALIKCKVVWGARGPAAGGGAGGRAARVGSLAGAGTGAASHARTRPAHRRQACQPTRPAPPTASTWPALHCAPPAA